MITVAKPARNEVVDINEPVEFRGSASDEIVKLRFISPFLSRSFLLGRTDAIEGQWSFSYLFNTSGKREMEILGVDIHGNIVDVVGIEFELQQKTDDYMFLAPSRDELTRELTLYATHYNVHLAKNTVNGNPLLDLSGNTLGAKLSEKDWYYAAMEGTVRVDSSTYNYAGIGQVKQVDCRVFFPGLSANVLYGTNRVRFKMSNGPFGEGAGGFILVPYRSIAVDRNFIDLGSTVYIPEAKGKKVQLPSGQTASHDGYFFAADVGGAINGNHIDVFLGISSRRGEFDFITSHPSKTFKAYLVNTIVRTVLHQGLIEQEY
ncbi:MAG: 3D domain-containing protein [Cyanobacteria bacterium P01_G01_bin.54]